MSRLQQDQFVDDDEEECCPLCVEEFDLSDRNFRPCPCGYQICQFCYNNIKTTMNGLCPACRRPYDDSTIEWKTISPEEMAKHKQQIAQKAKKNAQIRQKEAQKAEADSLSRKHLAGLRVVQKNLVYVTGLTPTIREDRLLDTLRGNDYFGQYGKIIKIVVSKARENAQHQQSVGVYVTFARKEDAEQCIKAVDGTANGDRTLRAQYGTTKYCSAYLRGETCNNRNCMFLHEPGEDNDSFTRQDLSMMNSIQTQQPTLSSSSRAAPPAHPGPPVAAATPMSRQDSNDASSPTHDAPGLPATASWGSKAALERRASRSTIASNSSPMVPNAVPAQAAKVAPKAEEPPKKKGKEKEKEKEKEKSAQTSKSATPQPTTAPTTRTPKRSDCALDSLLKTICSSDFKFFFSRTTFSDVEFKAIEEFPPLLDPNGGTKRRVMREKEQELASQREAEAEAEAEAKAVAQQAPVADRDDPETTVGGSLQLGGEPEEGHESSSGQLNQHAIAPGQQAFGAGLFGQNTSLTEDFSSLGLSNRGLTPQQQQQLLLSNFKSGSQSAGLLSNMQNAQNQQQHSLGGNQPGHARHTSRFSFANDSASASANVQPVANQKLMSQQNSMMPRNANQFNPMSQHQPLGGQFFANVQGPPPGLKPTGTPPVGGTGMFGQVHGFAGSLNYGARNSNDAMYQDLLRSRNMEGGVRGADAGKQDIPFSVEEQASFNVDALVNDTDTDLAVNVPTTPLRGHFFEQPRRATPTIPPGFTAPAVPRTMVEESVSGQVSRPMSRTTSSNITPAVPVLPVTPIRANTPSKSRKGKQSTGAASAAGASVKPPPQLETPTKVSNKPITIKPQTSNELGAKKSKDDTAGQKKQKPKPEGNKASTLETVVKEPAKGKNPGRKSNMTSEDSPRKKTPKAAKDSNDQVALVATPAPVTKRQPPSKLDITAATNVSESDQSPATGSNKAEMQPKNSRTLPQSSATSVPSSPATAVTGSPMKRFVAPRTLRVVPTPKTEVPPTIPAASLPSLSHIPTVGKLRSRQASVASVNAPGTPASEMISDTASITSASYSRASSPPPIGGKVGTAPVRKKTKSQAKKDRQERKRQIEEEIAAEENKSDVEVVQAPIIGRKKKAKKPSTNPKPATTTTKSVPASPKPVTIEDEQSDVPTAPSKQDQSAKTSARATPDLEHPSEPIHNRRFSAQAIMSDLERTGELLASTLEFFKPLSSSLTHSSRTGPNTHLASPPDLKIHFSEADLEALAKKRPVRLNGQDGRPDSRTLITPNGKFFWGLSEELEEKALELEKQIDELKGHSRFRPRNPSLHPYNMDAANQTQSKDVLPAIATALKEAGKKLGNNGTQQMPRLDPASNLMGSATHALPLNQPQEAQQPPPPPPQQTPADAGAYLNQFVLPKTDNPPSNQPRPEMAAVGGAPGAGTANLSVNAGKFAKAAKAVVEGGAVGSTEIEGMGMMAADLLGGVFVQGLEALVGAGLGFQASPELGVDGNDITALGRDAGGSAFAVRRLFHLMENSSGMGGFGAYDGGAGGRGRGSVMSMEEAERAMHAAKKEHDVLEKKLAALMKKNKKMVFGSARA